MNFTLKNGILEFIIAEQKGYLDNYLIFYFDNSWFSYDRFLVISDKNNKK